MKKLMVLVVTTVALVTVFSMGAKAQSLDLISKITGTEARDIYLNGEVSPETARQVIDDLDKLNQISSDEITLHINSPGGTVYDGFAIYDAMKSSRSDVRTVCEGLCASMAAFILSSGTPGKREAMPTSTVMVHEISFSAQGKLTDIENQVVEGQRVQNLINKIFLTETHQTPETLNRLLASDDFLSPEQAKADGFIDNIRDVNGK